MINENQSSEVKTKNITFGLVISWVLGVLFGIIGVTSLFTDIVTGILFLVATVITLPITNNFIKNKLHLSLSKGLRIFLVLLLIVIAFSFSTKDKPQPSSDNGSVKTENIPAVEAIKVSAFKLSEDYKANEVAADANYKGKLVEVTGIVDNIGKDILDTPYVSLKTGEYSIVGIQCMFEGGSEGQLASLSKGQSATLQGEVSGKMMNVIIRGCKLK